MAPDLFAVKAYHVKWSQLKTDANIAKWSVHLIELGSEQASSRLCSRPNILGFARSVRVLADLRQDHFYSPVSLDLDSSLNISQR